MTSFLDTIRFQRNGLKAFPSENANQFELILTFECQSLDARDLYSSWQDIGSLYESDDRLRLRFRTMREKNDFLSTLIFLYFGFKKSMIRLIVLY